MNSILLNICIVTIITSVFKMLVPDERNNKQIKLLLSCFFIITVFNIVKGQSSIVFINNIPEIETGYNDYTDAFYQQTVDEIADNLSSAIKTKLLEENIYPENILIGINNSENSSISFNEIKLVFKEISPEMAERAVTITRECVGNEIKVNLEGI